MTRMSMEVVIKLILGFLALIILLGVIYFATNKTIPWLSNIFEDENKTIIVGVDDVPFFEELVKNYQECKLSPSTECFCKLTSPQTSENHVLEITNNPSSKRTSLRLYSNAKLGDDCRTINPTISADKINTNEMVIEGDILYFEDLTFGDPIVIPSPNTGEFGKFDKNDFTSVERIYLYQNELCSTKDVSGSNSMTIDQGFLYKFDSEKTTFSSGEFELQRCDSAAGSLEALQMFNDFLTINKNCKKNEVCTLPISIPQNFEIKIESNKLELSHKDNSLRTKELEGNLCLFTHFNLNQREELPLTTLTFNDYLEIEIYKEEDKTCYLPYDRELALEKQVALARGNNAIVPIN